MTCAKDGTAT